MVQKQNTFSRTMYNDIKMGAYYTNLEMCKRIGYLFDFPDEEVSIIEPSIGDGTALMAVLGRTDKEEKRTVFGVELNTETYKQKLKDNPLIDYCLNADFLNGIKMSHGSFGFCFANPPYAVDEGGERMEKRFIEKLHPYMKAGAPIAYVIPYATLMEEKFAKSFVARFQPVACFKFDDEIYKQFHQVVLIGVRRREMGYLHDTYISFFNSVKELEKLPYLPKSPDEVGKKLSAVPSKAANIEYFTTLVFNRKEAGEQIYRSSLHNRLSDYTVPEYSAAAIGQPPIPLKKDLLYLLAVSGGGQGLVGGEDNDLHLQRGVAKVVTTSESKYDADKGKAIIVENSHTQICLNIIESDGTITCLE